MSERVCPWWMGYLLATPIRKFAQDPEKILSPYIKNGDLALDVGSAMGFFSLPRARWVGDSGHGICVDLQEKMIRGLRNRARRAGLTNRMEMRVCTPTSLCIDDLGGRVDFALAFAVVHEVPDAKRFLSEIRAALKQDGILLFSEPTDHVAKEAFNGTLSIARDVGFRAEDALAIRRSHTALLKKT